jgi:hypothetical protein
MLEENQAIGSSQQQRLGFLKRVHVVEFRQKTAAHALQNFAYEKKVFFFFTDKQNAQWSKGGFGCSGHESDSVCSYYR